MGGHVEYGTPWFTVIRQSHREHVVIPDAFTQLGFWILTSLWTFTEQLVFRTQPAQGLPWVILGGTTGVRLYITEATKTRTINLGGKTTAKFGRGDRIVIETPGGGGWGAPGEASGDDVDNVKDRLMATGPSSHRAWGSLAERSSAQLGA